MPCAPPQSVLQFQPPALPHGSYAQAAAIRAAAHRLCARAREAVQQHAALARGGTLGQPPLQQAQHELVRQQLPLAGDLRHLRRGAKCIA